MQMGPISKWNLVILLTLSALRKIATILMLLLIEENGGQFSAIMIII